MSNREYPCEFCDTERPQEEKRVTLTRAHNGIWYVFEKVPAYVCPNCGHRYYDGETIERLEALMKTRPNTARPVEAWAIPMPQ